MDCSDSECAGDPSCPPPPVAADQFCEQYWRIQCAVEQTCCTDATRRYVSAAACEAANVPGCNANIEGYLLDPRAAYNAAYAGEYMDRIRGRAAICSTSPVPWSEFDPITDGTVPVWGDCSPADSTDESYLYVCVSGTGCDLYYDSLGNVRGDCITLTGVGAFCATSQTCQPRMWCGSVSGCLAQYSDGHACNANGMCLSLFCDAVTRVCRTPTVNEDYCWGP
jgi:hypothetical protein